jgi:hypothetical protein
VRDSRFFPPPLLPGAASTPRCTQADQINIMVTKRVSWYKRLIELLAGRADAL